jgi:hypothetical protein
MTFETILRDHLVRYPAMQVQDMYKLIHQAAMGSEHAIPNPVSAREWMERELSEMGSGPDEPVMDPISGDGKIVRVHLRPFIAGGGDPDALLDAFIRTANEFRGDKNTLESYWKIATEMLHFSYAEMDEFIKSLRAQNYPAVHHSEAYERAYRPAYRVVLQKFIDE